MKKGIVYSLFLGVLVLAGCSPKVTTTLIKAKAPLESEEELAIVQPDQEVPEGSVILETMKLTGKDYDELVGMAQDKARTAGGDVLKIAAHLEPDITSPRHRVSAAVFSSDDSFLEGAKHPSISDDDLESQLDLRPLSGGWRFAVQGGGVYRLGKIKENMGAVEEQHIKNMRWGYSYEADASYFILENLGLGVKFHNFHSGDSMPVYAVVNGNIVEGVSEDNIDIYFIGPIATYRLPSRNRNNAFLARVGLGYEGYYDKGTSLNVEGTIKGTTFGLLYEVGYDFGISKHLSVGAALTFVMGFINAIDLTIKGQGSTHIDLGKDDMENISHLGLNIGLRYNL